jgi:hypothetical protein
MSFDASQDAVNTTSAASAVRNRRPFLGRTRRATGAVARFVPGLLWMLLFYSIIEWVVPDMNQPFVEVGYMKLTPLHVVWFFSSLCIVSDIYILVATQSVSKSTVVNKIIIAAIAFLGLLLVSVVLLVVNGHLNWLRIYATGEFAVLTFLAVAEWLIAVKALEVLTRRFVDMANSDITQHDHM